MTTWAIKTEHDRSQIIKVINNRDIPCTVSITKGAPRSIEQNKLQRKWLLEAEEQGDMTSEEYRGWCKAHLGVPILLAENEEFAEKYTRLIRPMLYEDKIELMMSPMDFPVTRIMTTKQKSKYLDAMYNHFTGLGFRLTEPNN